jgi:hypothetical protein
MASITIGNINGGGGGINPTSTFLPFNREGVFYDSLIKQSVDGTVLEINGDIGFYINENTGRCIFGDAPAELYLLVDDSEPSISLILGNNGKFKLSGFSLIDVSAPILAGKNLVITINGVDYKIPLYS